MPARPKTEIEKERALETAKRLRKTARFTHAEMLNIIVALDGPDRNPGLAKGIIARKMKELHHCDVVQHSYDVAGTEKQHLEDHDVTRAALEKFHADYFDCNSMVRRR